ncbi:hypothetical protein AMATHDRAFT_76240 [Amanita thiersii Skay4041]|uniref:ADF-H domain-containing protein n=1 Tax=Amanita thiersii Skay4041 TaxID=703135 RepID=A0A2A9NEB3_9AGAR|nr:hypothetical protein AMATHDRAFT_76240 [Amanita thiersii Skay4041]
MVAVDVTDPKINQAYLDVRDDKTDTNWLLLDYESDSSNKLQVTKTGTGGLSELAEHVDDSRGSFAYARVAFSNDKESKREKFVFVSWIGPKCKVMRKAKMTVHLAFVKEVLRAYSIEVAAQEKDDLKEDPIVVRLRKAGGASYDGI